MPSTLMLLSYPYRPDPRVKREARALLDRGIGVQLIAWDRGGDLPEKAVEEGVSVERLGPRCPYRSAGKVVTRLPRFWLKALAAARSKRFDVVHSHDFDTLPLGLLISRLTGKPMLYDAHEIYSDMIEKDVGRISRAVWRAEKRLSRSACELVTVNEALAQRLSVRGRRARVVTNSPDTSVLAGTDLAKVREKYGLRGLIVSYLGSLEPGRFVPEMLESVDPNGKVCLAIGGNGTLAPLVEKSAKANMAVKYLGTVETDEALRITLASDLVLAMLDPANPNYRVSTPVKALDAMACGRPVVISSGIDFSKRVLGAGCGFVIPYDKGAFKDALKEALGSPATLREMGRKGKEYFDRELSWDRSREELFKAYEALLGPSSAKP